MFVMNKQNKSYDKYKSEHYKLISTCRHLIYKAC